MLDALKKWFQKPTSTLASSDTHTLDSLGADDIIQLGACSNPDLSFETFQIVSIHTYDFEREVYPQFTLKNGRGKIFYAHFQMNRDEKIFAISKRLTREVVGTLFDLSTFSGIFEQTQFNLKTNPKLPEFIRPWVTDHYYKSIDCRKGYVHFGDYRDYSLPKDLSRSRGLDYYVLSSAHDSHGIIAEVFDHGRTEIYATTYLPLSIITKMAPKGTISSPT